MQSILSCLNQLHKVLEVWYGEWFVHQILAGNDTHNYYMLGTATKLSMFFQVLGLKVQKQEEKNTKRCRDGG